MVGLWAAGGRTAQLSLYTFACASGMGGFGVGTLVGDLKLFCVTSEQL